MLVVIRCRLITGVANKSLLDVEVHIVPCVSQSPSGGGGGDDGQENDAPVDTDDVPPAEPEEEPVFCRNCGCGKLSETNEDGITTTRYDAAAQPMASVQKLLVSQLSGMIESKSVFVSERGLTSAQWTEYSEHTKRVQYSTVPTSSFTAEVVTVDGSALSRKDTAGVVTTFTRSHHPALWYITWDPTQNIATRPLAIQKDGTWYTYGWDLTKNICEVYRNNGTLGACYTYTPYGQVSASGSVTQPIQWSSEFNDTELGLIYYNYRHYNPVDGRWMGRDPYMERFSKCLTNYVWNSPTDSVDLLGRDRAYITFNSEHDNTLFHATLRVDNWYIINGKYKKNGYVNYDFRPIVSGINEWIAIWSILNVLATPLVATATVYKTTAAQRTKGAGYKISNPCQDAILIRELDKEVGTFKIYNVAFRNCQWWVTFRYNIGMDYNQPCCNPDGTRYEKS